MLDTSGILSNHLQKLAKGNLQPKVQENEYTEIERLLNSISKRKLKQALEEVNFDVYEVLLRDLSSSTPVVVKHASSILSSFLEITKGGVKDKKSLLASLAKIVVKNKSSDDIRLCCDALKCIRFLVDSDTNLEFANSLEKYISEQLDASSKKPELIVIESLLLFQALIECKLLDLRDKTSSWLKCLLDQLLDKNPDVRTAAIAAFNTFKPCLTGCEKYLDDLENSIIKSKFSKFLIELLPSDKNWAVIWRLLLELMGKRFHHNSTLVNSLLAVEEKAFKSHHADTKKEAFINWKSVILSFSTDHSVLSSDRRVKLLAIPLRANNCRSLEIALAKFDVWWFLIVKLKSDVSRYIDLVLTPFLKFCFGPFSDPSLPSANGQNMLNNVNSGDTLGRLYPAVRVPCIQALTQILCCSAGSALPSNLNKDLVIVSPTGPFLKTGQDFCSISRILTQCVGEATLLSTSDEDFAWIIESWRSLLILINKGSGETGCFDETNSKDVKNISLVKDLLRLLINLMESVSAMPDSKLYGKVFLLMIEALCIGNGALHPSVLNSHVYSVGNSQLMTGSPTLLLASLLLSSTVMNGETDQVRFMKVFSNLVSLGLSSLAPTLPFIRTLLKKMETLTNCEQTFNECFPLVKLVWVSVVNHLCDTINKEGTVSEGNDAHHDFQCIYGLLMFPIAHFMKIDCAKENADLLLKPWEKLYKLFFRNSQFLITTQPFEVIEELCRKILVYVKKADVSLNYLSRMADYVLIIFSVNFYEDHWKNTSSLVSKGERPSMFSSRQLLYVLFYKISDLIVSLNGNSKACSEKHISIMSYLVLVISIGLKHDLMGFLFEKAAASVRYYLESTAEQCPKTLEKEMIALWEKFLDYVVKKVISDKNISQYYIDILVPLLEAGFQHQIIEMVELTKTLWKKKLGTQFSAITIPPTLADILENVFRDEMESEGLEFPLIKENISTSPFKRPLLQKNIQCDKKEKILPASISCQGDAKDFVAISPRLKPSILTEHQKEKMKLRRVDIPALYQDLTQDSASQNYSQELSTVMESSSVDISEDANPPFPRAVELSLGISESLSTTEPHVSKVAKDSEEENNGREKEINCTELMSPNDSGNSFHRRKLKHVQPDEDEFISPIIRKNNTEKSKNLSSAMSNIPLKGNEDLTSSKDKSPEFPSASSLIVTSNEDTVTKSSSMRRTNCTVEKSSESRVPISKEKRNYNQSKAENVGISSPMELDEKVQQIKESEQGNRTVLPEKAVCEISKEPIEIKEANNVVKKVPPTALNQCALVKKCLDPPAPLAATKNLVERKENINLEGRPKALEENDGEETIVNKTSEASASLPDQMSPVFELSRKSLRKSSRVKIPSTSLQTSSLPAKCDIETKNPKSDGPVEFRRKRKPQKLGTPSPISHIRKISIIQHQKRLTETEEIDNTTEKKDDEQGKIFEASKNIVPEKVSLETITKEEDDNVSKRTSELCKKLAFGKDQNTALISNRSPLKPKCNLESPKHKSPILCRNLDDWVIVKKTTNQGEENESAKNGFHVEVKSEDGVLSELNKAVCCSPQRENLSSPVKTMTKNCSVNLSRMGGIFASESAEVAFIAYQGSVIKCNLSPSKKEDKDQRKELNGTTVVANLFPSPRSKTGRGARMLNLAQGNKEEVECSSPLDTNNSQDSPSQMAVGEGGYSTPPMKKPRRIRPVQIGDVSPQYHSLENGCNVLNGNIIIHEYSPSASPKSSLMKKKRKAVQEVGEDSLSPSTKKSRRVSFADPIVSKHVEFCIPESERKFKKRAVSRCLKMPTDEVTSQGNDDTLEYEEVSDSSFEVHSNETVLSSDAVKDTAMDSSNIDQLGCELTKDSSKSKVIPDSSFLDIKESEGNTRSKSAITSKFLCKGTSADTSPMEVFEKEISQQDTLIKDNIQKDSSDVCDANSFQSCKDMEFDVNEAEGIEDFNKVTDVAIKSSCHQQIEACPQLRNCCDPIDDDLWKKLTNPKWRERCKVILSNERINTVGDLSRLTEVDVDIYPFRQKKWKTLVDSLLDYKMRKEIEVTPLDKENVEGSKCNDDFRIFREMLSKLSPEEIAKELKICSSAKEVAEHLVKDSQIIPHKKLVSVATECEMSSKDLLLTAIKQDTLKEAVQELSNEDRMKLIKWVALAAKKSAVLSTQQIRDFLSVVLSEIRDEIGNPKPDEQFKWLFQNTFNSDEQVECISSFLSYADPNLLSLFIFEDENIMKNVQKVISPQQALQIMIHSFSDCESTLSPSELDKLEDILDKQRSSEDLVNRFASKILQRLPKKS